MSFLLRLLRVLVAALLRPPTKSILEPSLIRMLVWPNDLDLNIHMNNGRYITLMDLGRMDLMLRSGAMKLWFGRGMQPLVGLSMTRHFKALQAFQRYTLRTRVLGWDEKWVYFEQRFERGDTLYCLGLVKGLMAGKNGPVPTATLLETLGIKESSPALPDHVLRWLAAERGAIDALKAEAGRA